MIDVGIVTGSEAMAKSLIVGKDTVYVHTDIEEVSNPDSPNGVLYKYHEIQYLKDEYIEMIAEKNNKLEHETTSLQLALVDVYEMRM